MHPIKLSALVNQVIDADGGETTAQPLGDSYRISRVMVHTSTAMTELNCARDLHPQIRPGINAG